MKSGRAVRGGDPRGRSGPGAAGPEVLNSRENRWLKEFRVALRGGLATSSGAVGVEGVRLVEEALTSGCRVEAVLFSESGERWRERLTPLVGRAALVEPRVTTLEGIASGSGELRSATSDQEAKKPCAALIVVLAGVQDPGNVGTILRTAAAFGATGAVTAATGQSGTASPYAPKALRASAGAALHLPIVTGMALGILLTQLKMMGIRTVASCVHQEGIGLMAPWEVAWCEPIALLVGNEGAGLPEDVVHAADGRIHIPMATNVESLNAGAAAAVVLYEAYRQRRKAVTSGE
jgi:RNA methyltransferase, TrmH family